jgi:DNA replication protein DnaC
MTQQTICLDCGAHGTVELDGLAAKAYSSPDRPYPWRCPDCHKKFLEKQEAETAARLRQEREERIRRNLDEAGMPDKYFLISPYVPSVAEWLSARFDANILLHGATGAGKSTSAGYCARQCLLRGFRVRWYSLSVLLDAWRAARCSGNALDVPYLFRYLESLDLLILDECDKPVNTDSTQEMMFRLLEDVANGSSHAHVWMLGNWYRNSIEDIFGNGAAARRRFDEAFQCAEITKDGKIKKIKLSRGIG